MIVSHRRLLWEANSFLSQGRLGERFAGLAKANSRPVEQANIPSMKYFPGGITLCKPRYLCQRLFRCGDWPLERSLKGEKNTLAHYTFCMALRLYAATTSQGKLRDFRTAASAHSITIDPLPGLAIVPAPEESGLTFRANAMLKANYYSNFAPGQLVLADDSGLEVDFLDGAPGVRSARFAADQGIVDSPDANDNTDVWNNLVLLRQMDGVPLERRTARYRCVLVVARDGVALHTAEGSVEGLILDSPRGTGGFGYDPLFYLPSLDLTMAEVDLPTKHTLSHRGRAIAALLPLLGA